MSTMLALKKAIYQLNPGAYMLLNKVAERLFVKFEPVKERHRREYRDADYLLVSPTNCGRTWLRIMLGYYLKLHYDVDDVDIHYLYSLSQRNPNIPSIKSLHTTYKQFHSTYQNKSIILLTRDPRDVIISRYYSRLKRGNMLANSLSEFVIKADLEHSCIEIYNDFFEHRQDTKGLLVIRYEDLKSSTHQELKRLLAFLGINAEDYYISQAIEYSSLDNMKKYEIEGNNLIRSGPLLEARRKNINQNTNFLKVRSGKVGSYAEQLNGEALEYLERLINNKLNPYFGYNQKA